ncbi:small subunit ribosomal protein S1 [Caminicella sporogenes DSM 14501]|uniref:Small subunit ribosomal protein S1 n=1 Tax=Caminicella sporogenes DSM 14501 TaxID=1121266 RepID=A0A1M6L590_9FIRM|nr:30S ribosomal protein S1 [Caminicella sporogenes]RKD27709.1 30S ribosomal protein S1 [Caminicella sporogenes]SHJ66363.1 small subunit ribosomal protein S1 [Caminicella sporogenes DSM 14501]
MDNNNLNQMLSEFEKHMIIPKRGDIIKGLVMQVSDDEIVVSIGYKSDGIIPLKEISNNPFVKPNEIVKEGDEIQVVVLKEDDGEGNVILSKKRVDLLNDWHKIEEAISKEEVIKVRTGEVVKGGIIAYFNEIKGFIPASQISNEYIKDLKTFSNKTLEVKVIEASKDKKRIVFSHRLVIEEKLKKEKEKLLNSLEKDQVVTGKVKRLADFGAFIDLGGIDGLIHISEISWGRIKHPSEVLKVGDVVEVYVKDIDRKNEKISLSLKQTKTNPWELIDETYSVGDIIIGKVVRLTDFGAFLEVKPGIEGLVHISQISERHIAKPSDELQVGETVKAKITDINKEERKMSLSIKEVLDTEYSSEYLEKNETVKTTIGDIIKFDIQK